MKPKPTKAYASRTDTPEYATWHAMIKFYKSEALTNKEWKDLSALSLLDKSAPLRFEQSNTRWAQSERERAENERLYRNWIRDVAH